LGENDGHDAGKVRLDHKVADLPLEVEVSRHDGVFACWNYNDNVEWKEVLVGILSVM